MTRKRSIPNNETHKVSLDLVLGHLKNNLEKERKQFNLSKKTVDQLNYIHADMLKTDPMSYSGIVERAIDTYYMLYKFVEGLEEKK